MGFVDGFNERDRRDVLVRQLQKVLVTEDIVLPNLNKIRGAALRRFLRCHVHVLTIVGTSEESGEHAGENHRPMPVPSPRSCRRERMGIWCQNVRLL